jgi:hypothetical protein
MKHARFFADMKTARLYYQRGEGNGLAPPDSLDVLQALGRLDLGKPA